MNSFFFLIYIYIIFHFRVFSSKVGIALRRESQSRSRKTSLSAPIVCPAFHTGIYTHTARCSCNNEEAGGIRLKRSNHRCILQALLERQGESDIGWPEKKSDLSILEVDNISRVLFATVLDFILNLNV